MSDTGEGEHVFQYMCAFELTSTDLEPRPMPDSVCAYLSGR